MHRWAVNCSARSFNDHRFVFEPAGALGFLNEHSGYAVKSAAILASQNPGTQVSKDTLLVRALAYKWIRILFRCWQTRIPYNETPYLNALLRRGSPLLNSASSSAALP